MSQRPALLESERPCLVGLKPVALDQRLHAGAHLLAEGAAPVADNDFGYITSVAFSPALGHWVGLGLLAGGSKRHGEQIRAHDPLRGRDVTVEVCDPVFYDSPGERLRG
jgi:sarcosine oxidase subunit alpha